MVVGDVSNTTGNETGITVNGIPAMVYGGQFVANHVPLTEGQNIITIAAVDTDRNSTSRRITVTASIRMRLVEARGQVGPAGFLYYL